jgi:hypothetical protein
MNRAVIPHAAAAIFVAFYQLTPAPSPAAPGAGPDSGAVQESAPVRSAAAGRPVAARAPASAPPAAAVHYSGCNAVRSAGLAPLYRGQPGYRADMDGDGDGIACEPHRRR